MITQSNRIGLDRLGIENLDNICYNFSSKELVTDIVANGEGILGMRGAAMVDTGIYTGRSPQDKYIVDESSSNEKVWWGDVNQKISENIFDLLFKQIIDFYNNEKDSKTYEYAALFNDSLQEHIFQGKLLEILEQRIRQKYSIAYV